MRKAFTLVELMVGVTILGVMTVALFEVYSSVSFTNRRLDRSRALTEAVRTSYEDVSEAVRSRGIDFSAYGDGLNYEKTDYAGSGASYLALSGGTRYLAMQEGLVDWEKCSEGAKQCFLVREEAAVSGAPERERLTPPEVDVKGLRFYVYGETRTEGARGKATAAATFDLVMRLKENPSAPGVPFQATVAEHPYNRN